MQSRNSIAGTGTTRTQAKIKATEEEIFELNKYLSLKFKNGSLKVNGTHAYRYNQAKLLNVKDKLFIRTKALTRV